VFDEQGAGPGAARVLEGDALKANFWPAAQQVCTAVGLQLRCNGGGALSAPAGSKALHAPPRKRANYMRTESEQA
jgi:hypothetical protein